MTSYKVGIVGESNYQPAIRRCEPGDPVRVMHEMGNPHDANALAVMTRTGDTIGYIGRDSWLREALNEQGKGCEAAIRSIATADGGDLGVVLDVTLNEEALDSRSYRAPGSETTAPAPTAKTGGVDFLKRLFR